MSRFQAIKQQVRDYQAALEQANATTVMAQIAPHVTPQYHWRGVYPFRDQANLESACEVFWQPLMTAFKRLQRREDIFIAGDNAYDDSQWVMSMGHFMGLFDEDFLAIPATGRIAMIRYAEFSRVTEEGIAETGLFIDLIDLMQQAGVNPLPPSTGVSFTYPGPRHHDGIHHHDAEPEMSHQTLALVNRMVDDLSALNDSGSMGCPPELLAQTWHEDMIWYGPAGIGASYSIERYQAQHQLPFRSQLKDKQFKGHVCRFAEGNFACFFGWPNLSNTPTGGWLGLPGGEVNASMQVVDVYRREGDKLIENWVLIDLPWWLKQQGLDVLARQRELRMGV